MVITDNLSSHPSVSTREWLADHPLIQHTFIHVHIDISFLRLHAKNGLSSARQPFFGQLCTTDSICSQISWVLDIYTNNDAYSNVVNCLRLWKCPSFNRTGM
jgi:hypothetical protein